MRQSIIFFLLLFVNSYSYAQEINKCGQLDSLRNNQELALRGDHWGYGYDDLLDDLKIWGESPFVDISSIGKSVQNRNLWELRISSDSVNAGKHTIYIHVRTHPNEVQAFWVANEIIKLLISDDAPASTLRNNCVFYIVPMYNPDGVELEYARENANKIDIESNWYADIVQQEVKVLRSRFVKLMSSKNPIELALNFHSAYKCKRYFVYHHANGTSQEYTQIEKTFINFVVRYFISGIQPWNFNITWKNGTPKKYPESWWWLNFKEKVLALTYEDGNCEEAGEYDKTAKAMLRGIADYFNLTIPNNLENIDIIDDLLLSVSPNPVKSGDILNVKFKSNKRQRVKLDILDITGKILSCKFQGTINTGWNTIEFNTSELYPSVYILRLTSKSQRIYKRIIVK